MNREEILKFLNSHLVCHLATTEGDQPHVRGMSMYRADEQGILFQTNDFKDLWHQIQHNPKLELCFNDFQAGIQVRVVGIAQVVEDQGIKEEIVKARPFLKSLVEERGYQMIKVFRVTQCRAFVWTRKKNFDQKEYIEL